MAHSRHGLRPVAKAESADAVPMSASFSGGGLAHPGEHLIEIQVAADVGVRDEVPPWMAGFPRYRHWPARDAGLALCQPSSAEFRLLKFRRAAGARGSTKFGSSDPHVDMPHTDIYGILKISANCYCTLWFVQLLVRLLKGMAPSDYVLYCDLSREEQRVWQRRAPTKLAERR